MTLLDYFGVFGWIYGKGTKSENLGNFGVLRHDVGIPRSNVSPRQGVSWPRHDATEREAWTSLWFSTPRRRPTPQRSTVHKHVFLSCFVMSA